MNAVIIENEQRSANALKSILKEYCPEVNVMHEIASAVEAGIYLSSFPTELVFLDIELGDGTAFDVLDKLNGNTPNIIFTTAYENFAIRAFKYAAVDYLLKPINIKELKTAVSRVKAQIDREANQQKLDLLVNVLSSLKSDNGRIPLPTNDGLVFVEVKNIVRLQAEGSYTHFYFKDKTHALISHNLKMYEMMFTELGFFRIHHSHLINLAHIKKYIKGEGGHVLMNDGSEVDVASRRKEEFLRVLGVH